MRVRVLLCALVMTIGVLPSGVAEAQSTSNTAIAQGLFDEAKGLMAAGKAAEACPKFEESQRLDPGSGTLVNLARCYEVLGRVASAWGAYLDAAASARASGNADREKGARERAAALAPKVARLVIDVAADARVDGLRITRDGVEIGAPQWGVPLPIDPGSHRIAATAPGHEDFQSTLAIEAQGSTAHMSVPKLVPQAAKPAAPASGAPVAASPAVSGSAPAAPSSPSSESGSSSGLGGRRIAAIAVAGVGVVCLAVGSVFGLKAMSKKKDAEKACTGTACTTNDGVTAGNDAHAAGNVSTVAMIVGAVGVAGGAVLWFTAPSSDDTTQVGLGLGGIELRGRF